VSTEEAPLSPLELANPALAGAMAALRRARKRAEEIAAATGTAIVMEIDGKIVRVYPSRAPMKENGEDVIKAHPSPRDTPP
jgi:hypothetical protein